VTVARAAALALSALVLAACGGEGEKPTTAELAREVARTRDRVDFALERVTQSRTKEAFFERMDAAAETIDDSAGDLEDTGAPEALEAEAAALVDSLEQLAFDVQATADQIRQPGFEDLLGSDLSFESWEEVNAALARLSEQGLEVPPLERH
jgi:hypothetical protein